MGKYLELRIADFEFNPPRRTKEKQALGPGRSALGKNKISLKEHMSCFPDS